ncbi:ACP S-malonyltransferase [Bacillus marinisedimentorum]|uniref:ACP S-malonyltransferase n=1 Tax=Bacillus marinisedimentorum TaxID=1821260 RepID=UPI0007E032E0|nr:ACP S-malonyltransferase [Bacillus marinisedimentorum]
MSKTAFVFPGQGAQAVGMGKEAADHSSRASNIFKEADERLGFSLSKTIFEGPDHELKQTAITQPALLTASIAIYAAFAEYGVKPDYTAGHSLGEYSALVAADSLSFADAVFAVHKRGTLMEEAVPSGEGSMAAVMGMDAAQLEGITREITGAGQAVQLANLNSPGQIVISGTAEGVRQAGELAKEKGARRVIPLNVSGPFHSSLMKPAAEKFTGILDGITVKDASVPVIANVDGQPVQAAQEIRRKLVEQLFSPVRWEESVNTLIDLGVDTFVEVGPGKVLSGLIKKIDRSVTVLPVYDMETIEKAADALKGGE